MQAATAMLDGKFHLNFGHRCSQIMRRTRVVGLFPNESSQLRLVTSVIIEISEGWETGKIYLQPETKKQQQN